jgi:CubicO group peptidase (beta-lactamase class C family)
MSLAAVDDRSAKVDELFGQWDSTHSPGAAVAVIADGEIVLAKGYGMANLDLGVAITPDSVFRIGSTSKQFTALCVALLAREGTLDLDASVTEYVPELPVDVYGGVTVRHMVHHTSGILDYLNLQAFRGIGDEAPYPPEEAIEVLSWQKKLNFQPGERYLYSNSGYFLLGLIVERVSGQTLAEFAQARIFGPLGMAHTHFHDDHTRIVPNRATGYAPRKDGSWAISTTILDIVGDGSVFTTVKDMAIWDRVFYESPYGEEIMEMILTPGTTSDGESTKYAFGLSVDNYRGLRSMSHGGGFVGYRAEMIRFPEQRFSVVCLMNTAGGDPSELSLRVADIFLADEFTEEAETQDEEPGEAEEKAEFTVEEALLASYTGAYSSDELRISYVLEAVGSELHAKIENSPGVALLPAARDEFVLGGWVEVVFDRDLEGDVTGFTLKTERASGVEFMRQEEHR